MPLFPGMHLSPHIVPRLGLIVATRYYRNFVDTAYKCFWESTLRPPMEVWWGTSVIFRMEKFREEDMIIYVSFSEKLNLSFDE